MWAGMPYVRAANASACAWLPGGFAFQTQPALSVAKCLTRAVCHHAPRQLILAQPRQRMEGPPDLERADALVVFAFEEEVYPRMRGSLPFKGSTDQSLWCLWGRCKV